MIIASLVLFGAGLIRQEKHASAFNVALAACGMGSLFISLLCGRLFFGLLTDAILFALILSWGIVCLLIYRRHPYRVFCIIDHLGIVISVSVAAAKIITLLLDAGEVTVETYGTAYWTLLFTAVYVLIPEGMYGSMFRGSIDRIIEAVSTGCSAFIMFSITAFLAKKGYNWETKPYLSDIGTGISSAAVFSLHGILSVAVMALVIILGWTVLTKDFLHKETGPVAYRIIGLGLSVSASPMFFALGVSRHCPCLWTPPQYAINTGFQPTHTQKKAAVSAGCRKYVIVIIMGGVIQNGEIIKIGVIQYDLAKLDIPLFETALKAFYICHLAIPVMHLSIRTATIRAVSSAIPYLFLFLDYFRSTRNLLQSLIA